MQSLSHTVFLGRASLALGALVLSVGCGADKDHADRDKEAKNLGYPSPSACPVVRNGLPDPGSRPVDCAAEEAGLEFMQIYVNGWPAGVTARIYDFENRMTTPDPKAAPNWFMYTDYSTHFLVPSKFEPDPVAMPDGSVLGPVTSEQDPNAARCGPAHNTALHIKGGPFTNWGGGMGISLSKIFLDNCAGKPLTERPEYCRPPGTEFATETLDISRWEGIAFWARRGPEGQADLRVMLGDKFTDDDLSYLHYNSGWKQDPISGESSYGAVTYTDPRTNTLYAWPGAEPAAGEPFHSHPKYCDRVKKCSCEDFSRPCTLYSAPEDFSDNAVFSSHFCWDPALDPPKPAYRWQIDSCQNRTRSQLCADEACNADYPAFPGKGDQPFKQRPCSRFVFSGSDSGSFCFLPGVDPDPVDGFKRCGDHWYSPITLTADWQFYVVPFTDLHQEGWAKVSDHLDLTAASVLRFTWNLGWLDVWLDDISFYRHTQ
jgi:hypothetical protein